MDPRYVEFEDILTECGGFGKYQKTLVLFLIPVSILSAFQSNTIHLALTPDHWCQVDELANFSSGEQNRFIRPIIRPSNCTKDVIRDSCLMFDIDYNQVLIDLRLPPINQSLHQKKLPEKICDNGWVYDRNHYWDSFAMHFDFVCEQTHELEMIKTVRTVATIIGTPFFGIIADLYGRRMSYLSILITSAVSVMAPVLCKEYTIFMVCQFIIGLTYPANHIIIIILVIEFMCPKDRTKTISFFWLFLNIGLILHLIIIYFIPHWIWISVLNTSSVVPLIFVLRLIPESLQWLLSKAKYDLVEKCFKSIMQTNNQSIPEDLLSMQVKALKSLLKGCPGFSSLDDKNYPDPIYESDSFDCENQDISSISIKITMSKKIGKISQNESEETEVKQIDTQYETDEEEEDEEEDREDAETVDIKEDKPKGKQKNICNIVLKFLKETTLFQILLILSICFAINLLTKQIFESNMFVFHEKEILIDKLFWTLIKIPVILIVWFLMQRRIGRRLTNAILMALIGLTLIALMFVESQQIKYLLSIFGILLNTGSVMITYLQIIEISPTTFRCSALTVSLSLSTLIVSIINFIHSVDNYFSQSLYLVVVSTITLLTSFLLTFIVETFRENMPQNMIAAEELLNNMKFWTLGKRKCDMKSNIFKSLSKWDLNDGLDNT